MSNQSWDTDWLRPVIHFAPQRNWMNDPNGLYFDGSVYHLFYQYNPFSKEPGDLSWGYAISGDLRFWEEKGTALLRDDIFRFSGTCVIDDENTSGLGREGSAPLVAIYTGFDPKTKKQDQRLAFRTSGDLLSDYAPNPVLDVNETEFRDPKVFWHEPSSSWVMVVVFSVRHEASIYRSTDLKSWYESSRFSPVGVESDGAWECPDLFELTVDDTAETLWVLKVDVGSGARFGGSGAKAYLGTFDGWSFQAQSWGRGASLEQWLDGGWDFYAAQSFSGLGSRVVWLAWVNNWAYAQDLPTHPWRGAQSLARELGLSRRADGYWLTQKPLINKSVSRHSPSPSQHRDQLSATVPLELHAATIATITPRSTNCSIIIRTEHAEVLRFDISVEQGTLIVTRNGPSSSCAGRVSDSARSCWRPNPRGDAVLTLVVDHSVVELFSDEGTLVSTVIVCPEHPLASIDVQEADVDSVTVLPVPAFHQQNCTNPTRQGETHD